MSDTPDLSAHSPAYRQQLQAKTERLQQLFAGLDMPAWQVYASPEQHYRMRAEFRIWHEDETLHYAMFAPGQKAGSASLIRLSDFPPASAAINALMPRLLAAVSASPVLKQRWYQVEFLSTLSGDMLVSMIYHKKLDDTWQAEAEALQQALGIRLIGRSKGQKRVLAQDYVNEVLAADRREWQYRQPEGGFTQPNAHMCRHMLDWACAAAQGLGGDLLELYCGNGNFTLPLARHFRQVLATELSKTSVAAAHWNIQANHAGNIRLARLSAEEFTQAWQGVRPFRRLQEAGISLTDYRFSTVFVDPPRAGIDADTLALLSRFEHIIYISCNPDTLRANSKVLAATHRIERAALFDQFPFTAHIESGLLLKKRA